MILACFTFSFKSTINEQVESLASESMIIIAEYDDVYKLVGVHTSTSNNHTYSRIKFKHKRKTEIFESSFLLKKLDSLIDMGWEVKNSNAYSVSTSPTKLYFLLTRNKL